MELYGYEIDHVKTKLEQNPFQCNCQLPYRREKKEKRQVLARKKLWSYMVMKLV